MPAHLQLPPCGGRREQPARHRGGVRPCTRASTACEQTACEVRTQPPTAPPRLPSRVLSATSLLHMIRVHNVSLFKPVLCPAVQSKPEFIMCTEDTGLRGGSSNVYSTDKHVSWPGLGTGSRRSVPGRARGPMCHAVTLGELPAFPSEVTGLGVMTSDLSQGFRLQSQGSSCAAPLPRELTRGESAMAVPALE